MALTKVSSGLISADASLVDLNIDAGTLYIDATNNRVGVKNQTPTVALDVTGDLVVSASATLGTTSVGATDVYFINKYNNRHSGRIKVIFHRATCVRYCSEWKSGWHTR